MQYCGLLRQNGSPDDDELELFLFFSPNPSPSPSPRARARTQIRTHPSRIKNVRRFRPHLLGSSFGGTGGGTAPARETESS